MKTFITRTFLLITIVVLLSGCRKDDTMKVEELEKTILTFKINSFIKGAMDDYYLWYKNMPSIDPISEFDSEEYFYKLLYEEDKWSYISDNIETLENSLSGIEKTFGYMLAFGRFTNTGNIFAVVEYVYPNSPAYNAGLKRGNIIVSMNNADMTTDNYTQLLYGNSISVTLGELSEEGVSTGTTIIPLTPEVLTLNPVQIYDVIDYGAHKIGYIFYTQFINDFPSMDNAFRYFQQQGITDLVVDLRYNPGGQVSAARYFCSSVAPLSVINSNNTLVSFQWNDKLQSLMQSFAPGNLGISFTNSVAVNLNLNKIYFLTGSGTASASELSITGLKPYMDVTLVGSTTHGKYTGSITLKPEDVYNDKEYYEDFKTWGLLPIVFRYANSQGVTDFKDGFAPDIPVNEDLLAGVPLGSLEEPLLKAAIEDITGVKIIATKAVENETPQFTIFDRGFSKYDKNKREVILDIIHE